MYNNYSKWISIHRLELKCFTNEDSQKEHMSPRFMTPHARLILQCGQPISEGILYCCRIKKMLHCKINKLVCWKLFRGNSSFFHEPTINHLPIPKLWVLNLHSVKSGMKLPHQWWRTRAFLQQRNDCSTYLLAASHNIL